MRSSLPLVLFVFGLSGGWILKSVTSERIAPPPKIDPDSVVSDEFNTGVKVDADGRTEIAPPLAEIEILAAAAQATALVKLFEATNAVDLHQLMDEMRSSRNISETARELIYMHWLEKDSAALFAYLITLPSSEKGSVIHAVMRQMGRMNPEAAISWAEKLTAEGGSVAPDNYAYFGSAFYGITDKDPLYAIALVSELNLANKQKVDLKREVFERWAKYDFQAALHEAGREPDPGIRESLVKTVVSRINWESLENVSSILNSISDKSLLRLAAPRIFGTLVFRDFDRAMGLLEMTETQDERRRLLTSTYWPHDPDLLNRDRILDLDRLLRTELDSKNYSYKTPMIARALMNADREAAFTFALNTREKHGRSSVMYEVFVSFAHENPEEAFQFALGLKDIGDRREVISRMFWQMSEFDAIEVGQWVVNAKDPVVAEALAERVAIDLAQENIESVFDWAEQLPDGQGRRNAERAGYVAWMEVDAEAAYAAMNEISDRRVKTDILNHSFRQIAGSDPEQAVRLLSSLVGLSEADSNNLHTIVAGAYLNYDSYGASQWIDSIEDNGLRDRSIQQLVQSISRDDPQAALQWAQTMSSDSERRNQLQNVVRTWHRIDPEAARAAVSEIEVDAQTLEQLTRLVDQ